MRLARPTFPRPLRFILTLALAGAVAAAASVAAPAAGAQTAEGRETASEPGFLFRLDGNPSRIFTPEAVWEVVTGSIGLELGSRFEVSPRGTATTNLQAPSAQAGGALVPFRDPAPAFSRNVLVTRDFSNSPIQTEPHIAVNPNDPDHAVIGAIDYSFPSVVAYVTFDAGENWEGPIQIPFLRDDIFGAGDPVIAFDREGNVYMVSISLGVEEFTVGTAIGLALISSIQIAKSQDGGFTWDDPISTSRSIIDTQLTVDAEQKARGQVHISFLDKPWLDIGPDPNNPDTDAIYVTYTRFNVINSVLYSDELPLLATSEVQSSIELVRSTDGGLTWSDPDNVSPVVRRVSGDTPGAGDANAVGLKRVVQGSTPNVADDGTVYVSWLDSTDDESQEGVGEIYVARSDDGIAFNDPVLAATIREAGYTPRIGNFRYWGTSFPQTAIGPDGAVNVVYGGLNPAMPIDDGDVYFIRSEDFGDSWSRPVTLGGDRGASLQFFPTIDVDGEGGIHVIWADMRDSPEQARYHIYYTRSEDNGETWGFGDERLNIRSDDARVTDFPSNPNKGFPGGRFIGDYIAVAAAGEEVYLVWPDTRLGEFGPTNQKIGFARRQAIPSPEIFISPPSGPGGQQVTVQGFNLQPDLNVFIQAGGVTIATERTNASGRFTTTLFMPVSSEGAQNVRVFDESGNFAQASYYTDFGFGDIQKETQALAEAIEGLVASAPATGADPEPEATPEPSGEFGVGDNGDNDGKGNGGSEWWVVLLAALVGALAGGLIAGGILLRAARGGGAPPPQTPSPPDTPAAPAAPAQPAMAPEPEAAAQPDAPAEPEAAPEPDSPAQSDAPAEPDTPADSSEESRGGS